MNPPSLLPNFCAHFHLRRLMMPLRRATSQRLAGGLPETVGTASIKVTRVIFAGNPLARHTQT